MTDARKFDELVSWHAKPVTGFGMGWDPGWRPDGGAFTHNISPSDPYWNTVLDKAQAAYGDPGMRFNTSDPSADRYLVFNDGTRVPTDGSLAYRDNGNTYVMNNDGSVSLLGGDGKTGQPFFPEFRRNEAGQYVPVDGQGRQVAPLAASYVDDPATGKRTYYNANGDVVGTEQRPDAAPPGSQPGVQTDEQQSGRTADAVRKLHDEMKDRYSQLSEAEGKLTEAMLTARTTTAEGQQKLNGIQQKIIEAVNNPAMSLDTPAGEQAFLKFLRSQVAEIGEVLKSGTLTAEDQAKAASALAALYDMDGASPETGENPSDPNAQPGAPASAPAAVPAAADPALTDLGLGPMEPMPDPMMSDLGMGGPLGADPLAGLASALPAAMGAFPPGGGLGGGSPLDALTGAAAPLAGLASQLGEQARREEPDPGEETDKNNDDKLDEDEEKDEAPVPGETPPATTPQSGTPPEPTPAGTPGEGAPPAAPGPPPPPPTTITLPDGSTANARTPELAQAVKAHLDGKPLDEAFREQHFELPPPGTPVTNPVDPSRLSAGMLGMFKDHYEVALSSVKGLQDGQVVPLSSIAASPDFLGWVDPSAIGAPAPTPAPAPVPVSPPAPVPTDTTNPAPLASAPLPTPTG
ncbi:DUF4226 domain-containing protein (plasmid) [Mycolicibacterium sp. ELW1]|uniref:DUF4226 domain-containing protein n=1 Tax=Mycobacteriaceae TaxID=1762 RepID=UPI0011ED6159|nr:DUF4226 domain-containing protein [Mycobacterium sp. ELW1]QEN17668.1 DUF4226 domain-containing protein [Mycobacterium sp. ELW1]